MRFPYAKRTGPLFRTTRYRDTKDPCPVFDGTQWHLFGSGGSSVTEEWKLLHATAPSVDGPWTEQESLELVGVEGIHVAAPGVIYEPKEKMFHMFVQTDFLALGGTVEHLTSTDGHTFTSKDVALRPLAVGTEEACIYDPHPAVIHGKKYITYSGAPQVGRPDFYLLSSESGTWDGPWKREGRFLAHEDVPHHNPRDHYDYEWGLEGSQLIELPSKRILLNAVCFLPNGPRGTRQRVFFAIADTVMGPYRTMGPVLETLPHEPWQAGENGHAAGLIDGNDLALFYQSRNFHEQDNVWRYGMARFSVQMIEQLADKLISGRTDKIV